VRSAAKPQSNRLLDKPGLYIENSFFEREILYPAEYRISFFCSWAKYVSGVFRDGLYFFVYFGIFTAQLSIAASGGSKKSYVYHRYIT
jgi:hypothetical protein